MKRTVNRLGIISVMLVLLLPVIASAAQEPKGPRIEVEQERYAMGNIVQGTAAVHIFEVKNAGDEPLVIESVKPS